MARQGANVPRSQPSGADAHPLGKQSKISGPLNRFFFEKGAMKSNKLFLTVALATLPIALSAQAIPAASRNPVQAGVAFSFASSDYGDAYIKGFSIFGDYALSRRLSLEADIHQTSLATPDGIGENSYLIGPRYSVALEDRANIYVKALGGLGRFTYESGQQYSTTRSSTYGIGAIGAGIEFRASTHINVRAIDLEYQFWPGFQPRGLSPVVVSMGVAYVH